MNYYHLHDKNPLQPDRWYLKSPRALDGTEIDPRIFTGGQPVDLTGPFQIPLRRKGSPLDFTLADFDMPVVKREYADALAAIAPDEMQRFPVRVEGSEEEYDIINVLPVIKCLDETRSTITRWRPEAGRPDMVGKYFLVTNLKVDPARTENKDIFRLDGWKVALIASQRVRDAFQSATGAIFERV